jgi:hypothetical protein
MAIVTWNGWRKEPNEFSKEACDFLKGGKMEPFYAVFGGPETVKNLSKDDLDHQAELEENKERITSI